MKFFLPKVDRYEVKRYPIVDNAWETIFAYDILDVTSNGYLSTTGQIFSIHISSVTVTNTKQQNEIAFLHKISYILNEDDRSYQKIVYEYCTNYTY